MKNSPSLVKSRFVVALMVSGSLCSNPARADPPFVSQQEILDACQQDPICSRHGAQAQALSSAGNKSAAATAWQAAYTRYPYAGFLFNMARIQHKQNNLSAAIALYKQYMASLPPDTPSGIEKAASYLAQAEEEARRARSQSQNPDSGARPLGGGTGALSGVREASTQAPLYKKWWPWTLVGVAVAGSIVGASVAAAWPRTPDDLQRVMLAWP